MKQILSKQSEEYIKHLSNTLWGIIVAIGVSIVVYRIVVEWETLLEANFILNLTSLISAFCIYSLGLMLTASCWALIIGVVSKRKDFWNHVRYYCLTNIAQRLPTPFPFFLARTEAYSNIGVSRTSTLLAMGIEIGLTLLGAVLVSGSILFFTGMIPILFLRYLLGFVIMILLTLFF